MARKQILEEIDKARIETEDWYGKDQCHEYPIWMSLMADEFGKAAQEANELYFGDKNVVTRLLKLRRELLGLAQLVVAAIEQIDRQAAKATAN